MDSLGQEVSFLHHPTRGQSPQIDADRAVRLVGNHLVMFKIFERGFFQTGISFYYTSTDYTGPRFIQSESYFISIAQLQTHDGRLPRAVSGG